MADCFPSDHCANNIIRDFLRAGGVCPAPFGAGPLGPANNPYPVASVPCDYVDNHPDFDYVPHNVKGIFSEETLTSLMADDEACMFDVYTKSITVFNTIGGLVLSSANFAVSKHWLVFTCRNLWGFPDFASCIRSNPYSRLQPGFR